MKLRALLILTCLVIAAASVWAQTPDAAGVLKHDDGSMDTRMSLTMSGSTVQFNSTTNRPITAIRFFGARYDAGIKPADNITVTISDSSFKAIKRFDKKLSNVSPGRETWQTITLDEPVKVSGKFYVTLIHSSGLNKGVYIGADTNSPSGDSSVGLPGTVTSQPEKPLNWMIRAIETDPSKIKIPVAVKPAPKPAPTVTAAPRTGPTSTAVAKPAPRTGTAAARPGVTNRKPMVAPTSSGRGKVAYRNPYRVLSFTNTPPRIPRGSGRVDATWNVPAPVTIELSYVGKPARVLEGLNVSRLVVDFPVPEPGLFNVTVRKPGYTSDSKQFRVVAGARLMWQANLKPGADNMTAPVSPGGPVSPVIEDAFPAPQPGGPGLGETLPPQGEPMSGMMGPAPEPITEPRGAAGAPEPTMQPVPSNEGPAPRNGITAPAPGRPNGPPGAGMSRTDANGNPIPRTRPDGSTRIRGQRGMNGENGANGAPEGTAPSERRRRPAPAPPPAPGAPSENAPTEEGV